MVFDPENPPAKVYVGPFFPGNEAHKSFPGAPTWVVLGGGKK